MKHEIKTDDFYLSLEIIESDVSVLFLNVCSKGFGAKTSYEINLCDITWFANKICEMYETLEGGASIEDCDGDDMCITFETKKRGYIQVSGCLVERTYGQELNFLNEIEQSYVKEFCYGLKSEFVEKGGMVN